MGINDPAISQSIPMFRVANYNCMQCSKFARLLDDSQKLLYQSYTQQALASQLSRYEEGSNERTLIESLIDSCSIECNPLKERVVKETLDILML